MKKYYLDNQDRVEQCYSGNRNRTKENHLINHDEIIARKKIYSNNKYKTLINFQLVHETRRRIYKALQTILKSFPLKNL